MAVWQSQKDFSSETSRTKQTVAYLDQEVGRHVLERAMDEYFIKWPNGEQVTLACLNAIGETKLRALAAKKAKVKGKTENSMFSMLKQHAGLWTAIVLARKYGAGKVFTYRQKPNGPSSTRQVPDLWKPELNWLSSYTPHKIIL